MGVQNWWCKGVSETGSAKTGSATDVRIDDALAWLPLQSLAVKKTFSLCKFWAVKNF